MNRYFLMDLERTLSMGVPCFWKGNKHGYTYEISHAGIFSEEEAARLVERDMDQRTVKVPLKLVIDLGLQK